MKILKNRSSVAGLLLVVAVVWGVIIYRLISFSGGRQTATAVKEYDRTEPGVKADSLLLNYRDPFLGVSFREKIVTGRISRKEPFPEEPAEVPSFRFAGKISKGGQEFLLIVSGGETRLIATREKEIEGFRLERIYSDSLCVCKKKKRYTIRME